MPFGGHVCSMTVLLPGAGTKPELSGCLVVRGSGISRIPQLVSWDVLCFGTGVTLDPSEDPDTGTRGWGRGT